MIVIITTRTHIQNENQDQGEKNYYNNKKKYKNL